MKNQTITQINIVKKKLPVCYRKLTLELLINVFEINETQKFKRELMLKLLPNRGKSTRLIRQRNIIFLREEEKT